MTAGNVVSFPVADLAVEVQLQAELAGLGLDRLPAIAGPIDPYAEQLVDVTDLTPPAVMTGHQHMAYAAYEDAERAHQLRPDPKTKAVLHYAREAWRCELAAVSARLEKAA